MPARSPHVQKCLPFGDRSAAGPLGPGGSRGRVSTAAPASADRYSTGIVGCHRRGEGMNINLGPSQRNKGTSGTEPRHKGSRWMRPSGIHSRTSRYSSFLFIYSIRSSKFGFFARRRRRALLSASHGFSSRFSMLLYEQSRRGYREHGGVKDGSQRLNIHRSSYPSANKVL